MKNSRVLLVVGLPWTIALALSCAPQPITVSPTPVSVLPAPVTVEPQAIVVAECPLDATVAPQDAGLSAKRPGGRVIRAASLAIVDPLVVATGTSGTYTVPRGYVVGWSAVNTGADSGTATVTITPNGPSVSDAQAQPAIAIPAGYTYSMGRPVIQGSTNELGTGTVFVFTGTTTYTVVMSQGGT